MKSFGVGFALMALAACGGGSGGKQHPALTHSPMPDLAGRGTISGRMLAVGGPYGASVDPQHGRLVVRQRSRLVRTIPVPSSGRFSLTVVPGTYRILGYSPQYVGGHAACRPATPTVRVRSGTTTHVDVLCQRR